MISLNKPVKFFTFIIVLLFITGICLSISPDTAYAATREFSLGVPEPFYSDFSGYIAVANSNSFQMYFWAFYPYTSEFQAELVNVSPYICVDSVDGNSLSCSVQGTILNNMHLCIWAYNGEDYYLMNYYTTIGDGSSFFLPVGFSFDSITFKGNIVVDLPLLYDVLSVIWSPESSLESSIDSLSADTLLILEYIQSYLPALSYIQSELTSADIRLEDLVDNSDALYELLNVILADIEVSNDILSNSSDSLLSILGFLNNVLHSRVAQGMLTFYNSPQGRTLMGTIIQEGVASGIRVSGIDSTLTSILDLLTDLFSDLNAERELWEPAMNYYRYSEVNDKSKGFFQSLWQAIFGPVFSLNPSSSFEYTYIDEYGDPQTGHISFVRLVQELIFSDYDDGSLDYNYFDYFNAGYLP